MNYEYVGGTKTQWVAMKTGVGGESQSAVALNFQLSLMCFTSITVKC